MNDINQPWLEAKFGERIITIVKLNPFRTEKHVTSLPACFILLV